MLDFIFGPGLKFGILVEIWEVRHGSLLIDFDTAARYVEKIKGSPTGETYYLLKQTNIKIPAAQFKDVMSTKLGKSKIYLFSPSPLHYYPMTFDEIRKLIFESEDYRYVNKDGFKINASGDVLKDGENKPIKHEGPKPHFTPKDTDLEAWLAGQFRRANDMWTKKTEWQKWAPFLMLAVAAIGTAIIMQNISVTMDHAGQQIAGISSSLVQLSKENQALTAQTQTLLKYLIDITGKNLTQLGIQGSTLQPPPF